MLQVHFGTMKNLQGKQETARKPVHKQKVMQHSSNPKLCAVAAYHRQIRLLGAPNDPDSPFFRGARVYAKTTPLNAATYNVFKGVVSWVRVVLGRPVKFKDCARRPVFTRLANALNVHDVAKAVGVVPRTMDRYHVANEEDVTSRAAAVLLKVRLMITTN